MASCQKFSAFFLSNATIWHIRLLPLQKNLIHKQDGKFIEIATAKI
jgi:hypothetical protein